MTPLSISIRSKKRQLRPSSSPPRLFRPSILILHCILCFSPASAFTVPRLCAPRSNCLLDAQGSSLSTDEDDDYNAKILEMVWDMTRFLCSMVDTSQHRFFAICRPPTDELLHVQNCPIRDLGAAWDASTVLLFWNSHPQHEWLALSNNNNNDMPYSVTRQQLADAVYGTIQVYNAAYVAVGRINNDGPGAVVVCSDTLREPSNIAHSAFVILASTNALRCRYSKTTRQRFLRLMD